MSAMITGWQGAWPEDLGDDERIRVTGPGGAKEGITIRVASGDRFTYRADDDGLEREVHADDGVVVERAPAGRAGR